MIRRSRTFAGLAAGLTIAFACALGGPLANAEDAPAALPAQDLRAAETFAMVWSKLRESNFDARAGAIDWAALESRHRPAIEGARDRESLRREILALLQAVGVSHLSLIPAEAVPASKPTSAKRDRQPGDAEGADSGSDANDSDAGSEDADDGGSTDAEAERAGLGLRVGLIDGALRILAVRPDSAGADAGVRPGWQLDAIGDWSLAGALASLQRQPPGPVRRRAELQFQMLVNDRLDDLEVGDTLDLQLRDHAARARTLALTARRTPGESVELLPGMPPTPMHYEAERRALGDGRCAVRVAFDLWAQPAFDRLADTLREQRDCDRLVLDLRANPGGHLWTLNAVAGLLHDRTTQLGTMTSAEGTLRMTVFPRRIANDGTPLRQLLGPVAILIDRGSASSSEVFASALQATGRARVFGETSAGMALPAMTARLPSGDWLYYPTADMTDPAGRRIEGLGVTPDTTIAPDVSALAAGRDPVLEAALRWIAEAQAPGTSRP